jgi:Mg/Co/Ni transporter MgtE
MIAAMISLLKDQLVASLAVNQLNDSNWYPVIQASATPIGFLLCIIVGYIAGNHIAGIWYKPYKDEIKPIQKESNE